MVTRNTRPTVHDIRALTARGAALKAALDKGEIGKPELLSITSFDPAPPPLA